MTARAFFNSIREGFRGIIRHPLVTMASITTIMMMLIIMGAFYMFSVNARLITTKLAQRPPIEVYMNLQCTEEERNQVAQNLANNPDIIEFTAASPLQNYEEFKSNLGTSSSILDDFDYNMYLPYTFSLRLSDPSLADKVCAEVATYTGVAKVAQESNVMSFLTRASRIVNITTAVSFIVLFIIALFIISNMVRISVYSRANEIEIMKFVGATNNYIRLPYITEGAIVGLFSAICSWAITTLVYHQVYDKAMSSIDPGSFYALATTRSLMWHELVILLLMGLIIGAVGSGISVRKYIKV
ncbi:permease-like cell division protein FtsX [Butyrivibrio sp. AE2032]|uniref:permease-like cell division protein FtsX n=1 Tax=Butyrivibrio sp. AE2032 TaxID=1458463 RepID=UPI00054D0CA7|nr:permease-like cell division protein FtsX [Butyrivibrio sp. AE2032]